MTHALSLAYGFTFPALYTREGLLALDGHFLHHVKTADAALHEALLAARANPESMAEKEASALMLSLAPHVEDFVAHLFGVESEMQALAESHHALAPLYACKRLFVQRRAIRAHKAEEVAMWNAETLDAEIAKVIGRSFNELAFAQKVMGWLAAESEHAAELEVALRFAAHAAHTGRFADGVLFTQPKKLDFAHLTHAVETFRFRDGFNLTDSGANLTHVLDEAHYCIYCHHQGRDSCSKGMREKDGTFKKTVLGVTQNGCPLEEHISEMNELKANGTPLGALAVACVNNPMVAGTGHRICNDCMKACIYQKQDPVDIPQIETRTLKDILSLPWGFEMYSLLTRWNPLNFARPYPKAQTGKKVLVVGLGPAGYTLAHHLLNDGHTVFAVDGLKLEPLDAEISGVDIFGERAGFTPIRDVQALQEQLSTRPAQGFGGVAEYGITVRWDKNFLTLLRLLLERREEFAMAGGVRFGGTITPKQAFELGFDHVALCMGAGRPTVLDIPNGVARGVRAASDFLMALQLSGAARSDSIANLQLRLPVVVVGGGLTAVDAVTESLAYYPVQVEKFLHRIERLGADAPAFHGEEAEIAEEFITHALAFRDEREMAAKEGRAPDFIGLMRNWGGVKLVYRKVLTDAPSYRLNHEEVQKALEEGMEVVENATPKAVQVDAFGHAEALELESGDIMPARTILVAAGTSPNTVLKREFPDLFSLNGKYFQAVDESGSPVEPEWVAKPEIPQVLLQVEPETGRGFSFFGDLHPSFAGNVVKAMGSAKQGYPVLSRMLAEKETETRATGQEFLQRIQQQLRAKVVKVERLTPTIVEVVLHAPLQAQNFEPGQFYRLQNFEALAELRGDTRFAMEGLALTGAWVDKAEGLISVIALEMGGSSNLCALLREGEPVVLMGPTGTPTHLPQGKTVMLVGGGLGNAVLFSIGRALKALGSRVLYFAGYKKAEDRYKVEEIEAVSDVVVWCCDEPSPFTPDRLQDKVFHGNLLLAMEAYGRGDMGEAAISLAEVEHMIVIGSDRMMSAIGAARHGVLKPYFAKKPEAIGSINSPMQCMMKEICAQCLQRHVNPETGEAYYVYSCFDQDQPLDKVDFVHLHQRLSQNVVQERLTARWIAAATD